MAKSDDHPENPESHADSVPSASGNGEITRRYFEKHWSGRRALIPHAPAVVVIARIAGAQKCADFFSELLGVKLSRKPVTDIVNKVEGGDIVVTAEQLRRAAQSHPRAAAFAEACPWVLDPKGRKSATEDTGQKLKRRSSSSFRAESGGQPKSKEAVVEPPVSELATPDCAVTESSAADPPSEVSIPYDTLASDSGADLIRAAMAAMAVKPASTSEHEEGDQLIEQLRDEVGAARKRGK